MVVDQNSFIRERPFFANKNVTFAKLSRTPCLPFAGPMLANNTSYEDSFTTCQMTPENHGSLLDSLLNMQLASRSPFSGQIVADQVFWQGLLAHPLQHALWLSPALSHNFRENIPIHRRRPSAGGALKEKRRPGALVFGSRKPHFCKFGCCIWSLFLETSKSIIRQWQRQVQGCASGLGCYLWRVWLSTSTTIQGTEPEPNRNSLVPFSCRTPGGSGWQPFT